MLEQEYEGSEIKLIIGLIFILHPSNTASLTNKILEDSMNINKSLAETGFLRLPQVLTIFPISRSAFWAGVKSGKYPKPVKLSERCTAWKVEDIRNLIAGYNYVASDKDVA